MAADLPAGGSDLDEVNKKRSNQVDVLVGARVRARRLEIEMTQERLGGTLGITFQQIQKYEKGSNRIGASRLQQIAQTLNVPVSYFFEGADDIKPLPLAGEENGVLQFVQSNQGVTLNSAFNNINDSNVRKRVISLVQAIAKHEAGEG